MSSAHNRLATALVIAQFVLAAAIVLSTAWRSPPQPALLLIGIVALAAGCSLAIWAWFVMGWRRLRIMPQPAESSQLLRSGPYRFIRHPMYTGVLVAAAGCVLWDFDIYRLLMWCSLAAVLEAKSQIEERLLDKKFSDYAEYRWHTWRFLPWIR